MAKQAAIVGAHGLRREDRAGVVPPTSQRSMTRLSDETNWVIFRFGATFPTPFSDEQFPVEAADKFSKQGIPDFNTGGSTPQALSDLAIQVKGAVIMGHSESGLFPLQAALINSAGTKGLIELEPGGCANFTDSQIATLAKTPILVVYGDHINDAPSLANWPTAFATCEAFVSRVNAAHGNATFLSLPAAGVYGNSHMMMLDKNNLQVADLILEWIHQNVDKHEAAKE